MAKKPAKRPTKTSPKSVLTATKRFNPLVAGGLAALLLVLGFIIYSAFAASNPWEPETWSQSPSGVGTVTNDASASNGQYTIMASLPTPIPSVTPTPPTGGSYTVGTGAAATVFPEKPGLTVAESSLTAYSGPTTVTGTYKQSNCLVTKQIRVQAGGRLELTNCKIVVNVSDSGFGMIGKAGYIGCNHCLVDATAYNSYTFPLILEGGGAVTYSEFTGNSDNVRLSSNTRFEYNYIHNSKKSTPDKNAHTDGIEIYYGAREAGAPATGPHIFIRYNYIDIQGSEGTTGDINITNDFGPIDGVLIEGNTLLPGNRHLYLRGDGYCGCGGNLKNIQVINNRFVGSHPYYSDGWNETVSYVPETGVTTWTGNKYISPNGSSVTLELNKI